MESRRLPTLSKSSTDRCPSSTSTTGRGQASAFPYPKTKVKTKGTPQPPTSTTTPATPGTATVDTQPSFPVDARALNVFRALFFNPDITSTPGEVSWTDFLHAMKTTGFAIQTMYGSVWQFQPQRLDVETPIQFHGPHPTGKIAFWVARRIGRRLQRAYGWGEGGFVLRAKEE